MLVLFIGVIKGNAMQGDDLDLHVFGRHLLHRPQKLGIVGLLAERPGDGQNFHDFLLLKIEEQEFRFGPGGHGEGLFLCERQPITFH